MLISAVLDIYSEVELPSHTLILLVNLGGPSSCFHRGCTILHSYRQGRRIPQFTVFICTCPCVCVDSGHPRVWAVAPAVVLTWIPPVISHVEHLFMGLLTICISSLENHLFRSYLIFKLGCLFCCCWVLGLPYIFWISNPYQIYDLQILLLLCELPFHSR